MESGNEENDSFDTMIENRLAKDSMGESLDDPFTHTVVAEALASLPQEVRTAFILKHAVQMPEESRIDGDEQTIAKVLGVSGRTVRNYLARAEASLRTWRDGAVTEKGE